jgi:hypothetical protein
MWQQLFGWTNLVALVGWLLLVLLPRGRVLPLVRYLGVGLLCGTYAVVLVGLTTGWLDPVRATAGLPAPFDYSVRGLRAMFASDGAIVVGWTHYLAFDMFVGCWIAEDADRRGIGRIAQAPVLLLTFLAGPAGLLLHYLVRSFTPGKGSGRRPQ